MRHMILFSAALLMLAACDAHKEFPDTELKVGHVLCSDGRTLPLETAISSAAVPVAVVFYVNRDSTSFGDGLAVYLNDLSCLAFADTVGVAQGTSTDLSSLSGNANTYSMYTSLEVSSPAAVATYDMWCYGQSAYLPSVAEMRLLYSTLTEVNPVLVACGGEAVPTDDPDSWYWTSTEVAGQDAHKAWLYSTVSGSIQETPKDELHRIRPVITLNR